MEIARWPLAVIVWSFTFGTLSPTWMAIVSLPWFRGGSAAKPGKGNDGHPGRRQGSEREAPDDDRQRPARDLHGRDPERPEGRAVRRAGRFHLDVLERS